MSYRFQAKIAAIVACASLTPVVSAGQIDYGLADYLNTVPDNRVVSTLIYLDDAVDAHALHLDLVAAGLNRHQRHQIVVESLQAIANASQPAVLKAVEGLKADGQVADYESFWIANVIRMDGTRAAIETMAARRDVGFIYYNYEIEGSDELVGNEGKPGEITAGTGPEVGIVAVRAPEVWALGFDGTGVLVSTLDTGVDGNHPALASRWRGLDPAYAGNPEWAWFDPVTNTTAPFDSGSHGTHTMGSVLGGAPGNQVGVAPGAEFVHAAVIDRAGLAQTVSDAILAFQWIADPDGNPNTSFDVPQTNSNSWGIGTWHNVPPYNTPCDDGFWSFIDAAEAAGCIVLFSAGNEGSAANTLRRPGDRAIDDYRNMAVASVIAASPGYPISGFSSRGPTNCTDDGSPAFKPDIAAPGSDVVSSVPGGGYSSFSGTSMASPHVNGVMALMLQACPDLTPEDAKQIIYDSAVDLGSPGKDNDYGYGMIDAYEAVQLAIGLCGPGPPRARDASYEVAVNAALDITLEATDHDEEPGGPIQYVLTNAPVNGSLVDTGNGHAIGGGEYPYTLVNDGNIVTYMPDSNFFGSDLFAFAGDDGGSPPDGGLGDPAAISMLVLYGAPSITTDSLPDGYLGLGYGPAQLMADQGQPALSWATTGAMEYLESDLGSSEFLTGGVAQGWHSDDNSWSLSLPFNFEFYGETYTQIWASSNGLLSLDGSDSDYSNSTSELIADVRITALWDDLRTDQGGDIYIDDSTAGQLTIRWDTVTYSGGNQCNFAVTLYSDGRIRFHYGTGNSPITATVGISSGDGSNYTLSTYDGNGNLGGVNSHEFFAPPLLPEGMSLSASGLLSGTPLEFGTFEPQFIVTDSLGRIDSRQIQLVINEDGCEGDIDGNGDVGFNDLVLLLDAWGVCPGCASDLDGNGAVEFDDLLILLGAWGPCI